ncbi:MAG: RNA-guided pseudouridylation complex pseudouridine synthase subunit Cbf5 [Candidatus Bathyarchaeota archaeon]|jgi:H/ACA ribonucleoprotein complex subunit 4|nr:RNA-guided pseudouridylation complex pseudouridine synthase subunit Cbf5 [Candidatus Bathyarchaeota archaeon]
MGVKPPWEVSRTVFIRAEEDADPDLGCPPDQRPMQQHIKYGVVVMDKPPGPTSHEVVAWVKRLLELDRAGHGGTLDPRVTGVLPIGLQESTKVVQALLASGKEYVCVMRTHRGEEEQRVVRALRLFEGEIYQRPPIRASVRRRLRTRTVYGIDYHEGDGRNWLFTVACQSGTYIRKLCYDVGEVLGGGAHMHELRRTRSGPFTEGDLVTMFDLVDALDLWKGEGEEGPLRGVIRPLEAALALLPKVWIRDSAVDAVCTGAALAMPGVLRLESDVVEGSMVAVMTQKGEGVALMRAEASTEEILESEHGIAARPVRVLMPRGTYPRMW